MDQFLEKIIVQKSVRLDNVLVEPGDVIFLIEDIDDNLTPHTIREKMSALQKY